LPFHKRVKLWHVVEGELPKTATRKVKRALVAVELRRLEAAAHKGERAREAALQGAPDGWLLDLVADVSRRPRAEVTHASHLAADLGFDSLMLTELAAALERAGVPRGATEELHQVQTVAELARAVVSASRRGAAEPRADAKPPAPQPRDLELPEPLAVLGKRLLGAGQRFLYREIYETKVRGEAFIPKDRNFIVVANHASHLDMGLVKVALGDQGVKLASLAARDYFFDTPLKRAYFGNLTNLIPMERSGSIRTSLRAATEALRRGMNLLMFPEGTRSRDGVLTEFKPTAGYLALECGVDTLPVYLHGTFDALPAGGLVPRRAKLEVAIGPPIAIAELRRRTAGLAKGDAHKEATRVMEEAVRKLAAGFATPTPTIFVHPEPFDSAQDRLREAESKDSTPTPTPTLTLTSTSTSTPTLTSTVTPTTAHALKAHKP
jgi:long-chain acyl-CoA synthetase